MPRLRLAVIIGTRPEVIKLAPLILAARARADRFEVSVVRTGQHRGLVDQLMDEFGIRADVDLNVMRPNQDLAHVLSSSIRGLASFIARERPDWVLVQGDTTTTFAGALAAFYNRVRIAHVEAGLRTGKRYSPFPEEANRSLTARLADLHCAPTERARVNLLCEGIAPESILLTGNTAIDALLQMRASTLPAPHGAGLAGRYILVTAHRRENQGPALHRICAALLTLLQRHPNLSVWIPMHPSPQVRALLQARLGLHPRVRLTPALGYRDFVHALDGAELVLTDSGGVQEECAALGKPVLVLREDTERPEAVKAGVAIVVGTASNAIVETASRLLDYPEVHRSMARPSTVFGDGHAARRILDALLRIEPARAAQPVRARPLLDSSLAVDDG